jgi:FkbM family methyltransferase
MSLVRRFVQVFHRDLVRKPRRLAARPKQELKLEFRFVLADLLARMERPFFVQVGGFDGVTCDPLNAAVKRCRLPGIVIEPQAKAFGLLQQTYAPYPDVTLVRAALSATDGEAVMHKIRDDVVAPEALRGLASFDREVVLRHRKYWPALESSLGTETVPAVTFATLFAKHAVRRVDILQIDTEGFDYQALKLFDVPKHLPSLIQFESKHLSRSDLDAALAILLNCGYRVTVGSVDTIAYRSAEETRAAA